jgi:hypothetical protein
VIALAVLVTVLGLLATARLTRLISADRVSLGLRQAVVRRWGPSSAPGYLVHCRWCVSMYVAAPAAAGVLWLWIELVPRLAALLEWPPRIVIGVLLALAFSHGTALLAGLEDED